MNVYEFTLPASRPIAEKWYSWFAGRGIPAAMFSDGVSYIVWRGTHHRTRSDPARAGFKLVKSANDFPTRKRRR